MGLAVSFLDFVLSEILSLFRPSVKVIFSLNRMDLGSLDSNTTLSLDVGHPRQHTVRPDPISQTSTSSQASKPIPPKARAFPLTVKKYLSQLMRLYDIPDEVILRRPKPHKRACVIGDDEVCLYEQALISGLRFPVPLFMRELLDYVGIAPA